MLYWNEIIMISPKYLHGFVVHVFNFIWRRYKCSLCEPFVTRQISIRLSNYVPTDLSISCQQLQQLLWCQGRWRGADVMKERLETNFHLSSTLLRKLCVHYGNGFDNVGSVYFFYGNPVYLRMNSLSWSLQWKHEGQQSFVHLGHAWGQALRNFWHKINVIIWTLTYWIKTGFSNYYFKIHNNNAKKTHLLRNKLLLRHVTRNGKFQKKTCNVTSHKKYVCMFTVYILQTSLIMARQDWNILQVKQSHYRPWQALRVPGGWGSQISRQSAH
jgi:hypothetical protein